MIMWQQVNAVALCYLNTILGKADNVAPLNTHVPTDASSGSSLEIPSGRTEEGDCA
jgi:hypothetical protein